MDSTRDITDNYPTKSLDSKTDTTDNHPTKSRDSNKDIKGIEIRTSIRKCSRSNSRK